MAKYKQWDVIQWIAKPDTKAVIISHNDKGDYYYYFLAGGPINRTGSLRDLYLERETKLYVLYKFDQIWNELNGEA